MNTITEARQDSSTSKSSEWTDEGSKGSQPKPGLGSLWLAIVALVAIVALGAAAALGAFDSSDSADQVIFVDPRMDADSHRAAPPASPEVASHPQAYEEFVSNAAVAEPTYPQAYEELVTSAVVDPRADADSHREPSQPAPGAEADGSSQYVNGGLDPETQQEIFDQYSEGGSTMDPRQDADHHREAGE